MATGNLHFSRKPSRRSGIRTIWQAHAGQAITAHVPGNVELDLQRAGVIPEPFYAGNIRRLRPYEFYEWWYTREFELPPTATSLQGEVRQRAPEGRATLGSHLRRPRHACHRLGQRRRGWAGGEHADRAPLRCDRALRPGPNRIVVRLGSAVNHARQFHYDAASMGWEHREEGLFIRKAPHVWGWDIMPRAVSAGIWRSVWLEERPATAIEQLYYWTAGVDPEGATLGVRFQFRTDAPTTDGFSLRFRGACDVPGTFESARHVLHTFDYEWPARVPGRRLPHPGARRAAVVAEGLRRAEPVHCDGAIVQGRTGAGRPRRSRRHPQAGGRSHRDGRRRLGAGGGRPGGTRRVDAAPDPASHFVFYVNGEPIMVKGANWVPLDAFHSRDAERVRSGRWRSSTTWAAT